MSSKKHDRQYDLVIFGATGYTGVCTAELITTSLPTNLHWALAGRSRAKLEQLANDLKELNPDRSPPGIEICGLNDEDLQKLAKKAFVLISTVGPYALYGEHAFKACAENGTHYLDVTGEAPYVARMIKKHEAAAKASGAQMIPQIGIESCLPDVATWVAASLNRQQLQAKTASVTASYFRLDAVPSGGTLASVLSLFEVFSIKEVAQTLSPFSLSPVPNPHPPIQQPGLFTRLTGLRTFPHLGLQTTSMAGATDATVVERTWGLLSLISSKKDEFYGPKFTFAEYMKARSRFSGFMMHVTLAVGGLLLVLPPFRWLLRKLVTKPGEGPDKSEAKNQGIELRCIATPDVPGGTSKKAYCRVHYTGSMYGLTAIFLAQAALTLIEDDVALGGGVFTPACLGQGFVDRLDKSGCKFEASILSDEADFS